MSTIVANVEWLFTEAGRAISDRIGLELGRRFSSVGGTCGNRRARRAT